jgi:hypothetical protein
VTATLRRVRMREVHVPSRASWLPIAIAALAVALLAAVWILRPKPEAPAAEKIEVRGPPNVILAMHDLAKLETSSFHIEKVIEITEHQKSIFGLVDAKDALLLVAVGEVVAGVDLQKVDPSAVKTDWAKRSVSVTLPLPELFHARLDNAQTHVYSRSTDTLAKRNESLESKARLEAEQAMRDGALKAGILGRARAQAERTVRATLRSLGFEHITIAFPDK